LQRFTASSSPCDYWWVSSHLGLRPGEPTPAMNALSLRVLLWPLCDGSHTCRVMQRTKTGAYATRRRLDQR